jgi:hypothetical protein
MGGVDHVVLALMRPSPQLPPDRFRCLALAVVLQALRDVVDLELPRSTRAAAERFLLDPALTSTLGAWCGAAAVDVGAVRAEARRRLHDAQAVLPVV